MARPFDFRPDVIFAARCRQNGLCALLGCRLADSIEHAHHVVPNQSGDAEDPADSWLRSVDNCVVLCSTCHARAHQDGNYQQGAVAPPSYFPFSHGDGFGAHGQHQNWAFMLDSRAQAIWQRLSAS